MFVCLCLGAAPAAGAEVTPDSAQLLTLSLENVAVADVLNLIAVQNGLNLVVSGEVTGTVSLRLEEVSWTSALDAILLPMGYNYFVRGEVIIVKPFDQVSPGELDTRTVTLRFLDPVTAKKALEPLKSAQGQIIVLDKSPSAEAVALPAAETYRPNRLLLADFPSVVDRMLAVLEEIDQPEPVVTIEARIIETNVDDDTRIGFTWPTVLTATLGGDSASTGGSGLSGSSLAWDPNNGDLSWARLSAEQVSVMLHLLEQGGNSRLISDPHVTTLANHEAEIKIQTVIPIATINRFTEGAVIQDIVTFQDEEVGISLRVTPRVNREGMITMEVIPVVEDIIDFTGPVDNQKPITTERSVRTTVAVAEGETLALGGLRKESELKQKQRVPLLGRIPLLGNLLFTYTSNEKKTTDLIILITPRVLP